MVSEIWGGPKFTLVGAADFAPPLWNVGANWEIWHGSLFKAATAPTSGMTLAALYSAWAAGTGIYKKFSIFALLVLGVGGPSYPMRHGSGSWGTHPPHVWCGSRPIIGPWQVCFYFPIKRSSSKIRRFEDDWGQNLGRNLEHFAPVKRGQHGSNVCGYFMSSAGGPTVGIVLAGVCWADSHL